MFVQVASMDIFGAFFSGRIFFKTSWLANEFRKYRCFILAYFVVKVVAFLCQNFAQWKVRSVGYLYYSNSIILQ